MLGFRSAGSRQSGSPSSCIDLSVIIEGRGTVLGPALATPLPDPLRALAVPLPLPLAPVLDGVSSATAGLVRFLITDIRQP